MTCSLAEVFERIVCINLRSCPDRWEQFKQSVERAGTQAGVIRRFDAIDGTCCPPPGWWRAGRGAWGCHQSHVRIVEEALQDGVKSLLILEDDVVFVEDFAAEFSRFWTEVPGDWDGVLLGGQHLKPPRTVGPGILRVINGNRTHAHALQGRYIAAVYRHLCDYPAHAKVPHRHVDHRLGALHESGTFNIYAPHRWLIGQSSGFSSIRRAPMPERFWNGRSSEVSPAQDGAGASDTGPAVAILGPYRSGSSCVAGILHRLGFHMGQHLMQGDRHNEQGFFEPLWLRRQLQELCDEPRLAEPAPREFKVRILRQWLGGESKIAASHGKRIAAKHPLFCLLGNELVEAWGAETKFISIVRPLEESARSLDRTGWWRPAYRQFALKSLWDAREAFLADRDHLAVHYETLLGDARSEISRIAGFLGISPTEAQFEAAAGFVRQPVAVGAN